MRLSEYAKKHSLSYRTAHRLWKAGKISGAKQVGRTIFIPDPDDLIRGNDTLSPVLLARLDALEASFTDLAMVIGDALEQLKAHTSS